LPSVRPLFDARPLGGAKGSCAENQEKKETSHCQCLQSTQPLASQNIAGRG